MAAYAGEHIYHDPETLDKEFTQDQPQESGHKPAVNLYPAEPHNQGLDRPSKHYREPYLDSGP